MAVTFVFLLSSFFAQSSGTHWKLQKVKMDTEPLQSLLAGPVTAQHSMERSS